MRRIIVCATLLLACARSEIAGGPHGDVDLECHPGGPMRVLASDPNNELFGAFVDGDDVYFTDTNRVEVVSRTGVASRVVVDEYEWLDGMHVTTTDIVYVGAGVLRRAPKAGGSTAPVPLGAHPAFVTTPYAFTVFGDDVYSITGDGVLVLSPKNGTPSDLMTLSTWSQAHGFLFATGSFVYLLPFGYPDDSLFRMTPDGTVVASIPEILNVQYLPVSGGVYGVGFQGKALFMSDDSDAFTPFADAFGSNVIALYADEQCVYVGDVELTSSIVRLCRDGTKTTLVDGLAFPQGFSLDAKCMYIADGDTVFRLPRP